MKTLNKHTKERVRKILEEHPETRDDDNKLIAIFLLRDAEELGLDTGKRSVYDLLKMMYDGKLTSPESIRRQRQKLQAENIHLRGSKYEERQANQTKVKQELGYP